MLNLKHVENSRSTRNKLKVKVFITNPGFCRPILTGLMGLLGQTLIERMGLLGKTVGAQAGLLKLVLLK